MSVTFDEVLLSPDYAPGASGGPEYLTTIISAPSGLAQRNISRYDAIGRWTINYEMLTAAQLTALEAFFRARFGRARGFRFIAPSDHTASREVFGTGDGTTKTFKLVKNYQSGPALYTRRITKPVAGGLPFDGRTSTVSIFLGNSQTPATGVAVDSTTGLVTFTNAPGAGVALAWSGEFDVPAVFGSDKFEAQMDVGAVSGIGQIEIIELLPVELGLE
ncbi:MAG: DUF2460 domain-containing protein [Blastocatellia bacterium]